MLDIRNRRGLKMRFYEVGVLQVGIVCGIVYLI